MPQIHHLEDLTHSDVLDALPGGVAYHFTVAAGPQSVTLTATTPDAGVDNLVAHATCSVPITGLGDLAGIVSGFNFDQIPPELPISAGLHLSGIAVVVDRTHHELVSLTLDLTGADHWHLIPELLTLQQVTLGVTLFFPPLAGVSKAWTRIFGTFELGGTTFDASIRVPELELEAELAPDGRIALGSWLAALLPGSGLEHLEVEQLRVSANARKHSYAFQGTLVDAWTVIPGVSLSEVELAVMGAGSAAPFGSVEATFDVGGGTLRLGGERVQPTGAWHFAGSTRGHAAIPLGHLATDLASKFSVALPAFVDHLTLDTLDADLDTGAQRFSFRSLWDSSNELTFDLHLHEEGLGRVAIAGYYDQDGASRRVSDLVHPVSSALANAIPSSFEISLKNALGAWVQPSSGTAKACFAVGAGTGINLSHLPLVGKAFPAGETVKLDLQILAASADFDTGEMAALGALAGKRVASWPQDAVTAGLDLRTTVQFGGHSHKLELPVRLDHQSGAVTHDPNAAEQSGTKWFPLQKTFGPVELERVGLAFHSSSDELELLLDASFSLGGFSLALEGLGVSSPLTHFEPHFELEGLGMDFSEGPLQILGAFLRKEGTRGETHFEEYDGALIVNAELGGEELGLHAIGSYARFKGHPSLFLYAVLDFPLGGPPFFFVEGLAAGFGYNRSLTVPSIDQVAQFPLVAEARDGDFPDTGAAGDLAAIVEQQLDKLDDYIGPAVGAGFVAIGVKFSSFKLIDSFALLTVELGGRFEIDLLGVSSLSVPPNEGDNISPLAYVELLLKASVIPAEGVLAVEAELARSSYLFSPDCELTGGFAFFLWFAGDHAGDFVVTLGGYHPDFVVPSHYPQVPRLGFNWRIDSHTSISGESYFALCAHALMAGCALHASYHSGPAHASFRAGADLLICWKPYHYDLHTYVDISASYSWIGPIDVGADLHIWGPDFGGWARIKVVFWHVTIEFGDQSSSDPLAIDWGQFEASFLPHPTEVCAITNSSGLKRKLTSGGTEMWVVNPRSFSFEVSSFFPVKTASQGSGPTALSTGGAYTEFGIAPMGVTASSFVSSQHITITYDNGSAAEHLFTFEPMTKKAPSAMWGDPDIVSTNPVRLAPPAVNQQRFVTDPAGADPLAGYRISHVSAPTEGAAIHDLRAAALLLNTHLISDAYAWQTMAEIRRPAGNDPTRRQTIQNTFDNASATRDPMLTALGFDAGHDVALDIETLVASFVIAPQIDRSAL